MDYDLLKLSCDNNGKARRKTEQRQTKREDMDSVTICMEKKYANETCQCV